MGQKRVIRIGLIVVFVMMQSFACNNVYGQVIDNAELPPIIDKENLPDSLKLDAIKSIFQSKEDQKNFKEKVKLQGLNKITARISPLAIAIGEHLQFGNLDIAVHACWKSPPEVLPEDKVLLEIWEKKLDEQKTQLLFYGWMFSSSPGLSALEHPVYDITVVECV